MQRIVFLLLAVSVSSVFADEKVDCLQPQCIRAIEPSAAATPVDTTLTTVEEDAESTEASSPENVSSEQDEPVPVKPDEDVSATENDTAPATSENDADTSIPETMQPEQTTAPVSENADTPADENDGDASSSETIQPEQTTVPVSTENNNSPAPETTATSQSPAIAKLWIIIAAITALLLLAVVLWLLLRRKAHKQPQAFAELVEYQPQGEVRHRLHQVVTQLGRSPRCEIVFTDGSISAIHAAVKREADGLVNLIDLKSSNGTKVNNQPVSQTALSNGDMIELGETKLRYQQLR